MKVSARNQFKGKVLEIVPGQVNAKVVVDIGGGHKITSIVSLEAVEDLGLKPGSEVISVIKSTSVLLMA